MSLPVGGHGSQKCYKLIDRFEAEVIVWLVLIGQFEFQKSDDCIPEIEWCHKASDRILREIYKSQTSIISVPDLALADCTIYSTRV